MKTFIIRMKNNDISEDLANDLIKTLEKFSIEYSLFDAVYGDNIEDEWNKNNLRFFHKQNENKKLLGVKGCFLSHYLLWKKCIELNKPILILEHDAQIIRKIPENILNYDYEVLNLDYASRVESDYELHLKSDKGKDIISWPIAPKKKGWLSQANKSSIKGIHAYIVKPIGAKKLVDFAKENGTVPADVHVNSMFVDLRYTVTSYARINPKYWIDAKNGSSHSFTRAKE